MRSCAGKTTLSCRITGSCFARVGGIAHQRAGIHARGVQLQPPYAKYTAPDELQTHQCAARAVSPTVRSKRWRTTGAPRAGFAGSSAALGAGALASLSSGSLRSAGTYFAYSQMTSASYSKASSTNAINARVLSSICSLGDKTVVSIQVPSSVSASPVTSPTAAAPESTTSALTSAGSLASFPLPSTPAASPFDCSNAAVHSLSACRLRYRCFCSSAFTSSSVGPDLVRNAPECSGAIGAS